VKPDVPTRALAVMKSFSKSAQFWCIGSGHDGRHWKNLKRKTLAFSNGIGAFRVLEPHLHMENTSQVLGGPPAARCVPTALPRPPPLSPSLAMPPPPASSSSSSPSLVSHPDAAADMADCRAALDVELHGLGARFQLMSTHTLKRSRKACGRELFGLTVVVHPPVTRGVSRPVSGACTHAVRGGTTDFEADCDSSSFSSSSVLIITAAIPSQIEGWFAHVDDVV
jgi:hypothetical protein